MRSVSRCSICLLKLAVTASDSAGAGEERRLAAVKAALAVLSADDFSRIPPAIAKDVLTAVNRELGTDDPFLAVKKEHDREATRLSDAFAPVYIGEAKNDDDRLMRCVRIALAGNGMDLATLGDDAAPARFEKWINVPWAVNHSEEFKTDLSSSDNVLYLLDNAGEVAFDRFLVNELLARGKSVTLSAKGGPALNDATLEDVKAVGLDRLPAGRPTLITTGQATMGVVPGSASIEFMDAFKNADLVIAKGQANLESLHDYGRPVYFITLIKCAHVADYYGIAKGSAMLIKGGLD